MTETMTRRAAIAAAAAFAVLPAVPAAAGAKAPSNETPITRLWAEAERLKEGLSAHRAAIAAAEDVHGTGLSGWVYLPGEPNAIGHRRYDTLVEILNQTPKGAEDYAIMHRAARDADIVAGPRAWATARLEAARHALV